MLEELLGQDNLDSVRLIFHKLVQEVHQYLLTLLLDQQVDDIPCDGFYVNASLPSTRVSRFSPSKSSSTAARSA
jgi:hypothetical protein